MEDINVRDFDSLEIVVPQGESLKFSFTLSKPGNYCAKFILEDDAKLEVLGNFSGLDDGRIDLVTEAIHKGKQSFSRTKVKGLLRGKSHVNYDGWIRIMPGAYLSDAFLEQRALILDSGGEAKFRPLLEIEADDVKASHAASVGKINEDEIFYLMSRGISRQEAIELIANGFLRL